MIPKFRAWDKEGNRMILPKYLYSIDLLKEQVTERTKCNYTFSLHSIPFEKVEFMQSTGLKDKNGKEIFEGDILGTKNGLLIGVVEYRADLGMFVNSLIRYNNFERLCSIASDREIIGNVYENPELLEVTE